MSSTHQYATAASRCRTTIGAQHARANAQMRCTRPAHERATRSASQRCRRPHVPCFAPVEIGVLLLLVAVLGLCAFWSGSPDVTAERLTVVRVETGETLWGLARAHPVPGLSTGETVRLIARLNNLEGRHLTAGSAVRVPTTANPDVAAR